MVRKYFILYNIIRYKKVTSQLGVCQSTGGFIGSFRIRKETAKALLYDILTSLAEFGFKNIFGVNAHGDIEHNIAIMEAFKEASEQHNINACYAFEEWRLPFFAKQWLFGGHIKELSSEGYLGMPSNYENVMVQSNVDDYADRISRAILESLLQLM